MVYALPSAPAVQLPAPAEDAAAATRSHWARVLGLLVKVARAAL